MAVTIISRPRFVCFIPKEILPVRLDPALAGGFSSPPFVRLRFRNNAFALVFLRSPQGIRCFALEDRGDHWFINPKLEQARNYRPADSGTAANKSGKKSGSESVGVSESAGN